jgi:hypothetical protein
MPNSSGKAGLGAEGFSQRSMERGASSPTTTLGNMPGSKSTNIRIKRKYEDLNMKSPAQSSLHYNNSSKIINPDGKKKQTDYLAELRRKREAGGGGGRQKQRIDDSNRTIDQLMND